jgi:hypothetical protein
VYVRESQSQNAQTASPGTSFTAVIKQLWYIGYFAGRYYPRKIVSVPNFLSQFTLFSAKMAMNYMQVSKLFIKKQLHMSSQTSRSQIVAVDRRPKH